MGQHVQYINHIEQNENLVLPKNFQKDVLVVGKFGMEKPGF